MMEEKDLISNTNLINKKKKRKKHLYFPYYCIFLSLSFRQLVEGTEVLRRLEEVPTYNERPKQDCKIVSCGLFDP